MRTQLTTRAAGVLVAHAVCLTLLAGCGGDATERSTGEPGASAAAPAETSAGNAQPAAVPEKARGPDAKAAEAFAAFWVRTLNRATSTGDTETLKALASDDCESCRGFAATLDEIYAAGGNVESKGWKLRTAVPLSDRPEDEPAFRMEVVVSPQDVTTKKGAKAQSYKGGPQAMTMFLVRHDDRWLVDRVDLVT